MRSADAWYICRVGYVEAARAVARSAGKTALARFRTEWASFDVIELDQPLAESAATLARTSDLRSLDAIHLAAALLLPRDDLTFATWDRRQREAAAAERLPVVPDRLS